MKRFLTVALSLLLIFSITACGNIVDPEKDPTVITPSTPGGSTPVLDGNREFSVTLFYNNEAYTPPPAALGTLFAQWSDGFNYYQAPFDENGVAKIKGLNGDYKVSLLGLETLVPEGQRGYTYNPNIYSATNNNPDIRMDIYRIEKLEGSGTSFNGAHTFTTDKSVSVYRLTFTSANEQYFFFVPDRNGIYIIESWANVNDNRINPKFDVYNGTHAYQQFSHTVDVGGEAATYTKNFLYKINVDDSNIGVGNGMTVPFAIRANVLGGEYPVTFDVAVRYLGSYDDGSIEAPLVIPQEDRVYAEDFSKVKYKFVYPEIKQDGNKVFDGDYYKYFDRDEDIDGDGVGDGDGYYHYYNLELYPDSGGYGPVLYADITVACRFLDEAFTTLEYRGNKALTVTPEKNYKLFIEGVAALMVDPPAPEIGPYLCTNDCPCRLYGHCESVSIGYDVGFCFDTCTRCSAGCRKLPSALKAQIAANPSCLSGYAQYVNSDGRCPVTAELQEFLQLFSCSQNLFMDGNGWVETNDTVTVYASEDDQWLFACGYYVER